MEGTTGVDGVFGVSRVVDGVLTEGVDGVFEDDFAGILAFCT